MSGLFGKKAEINNTDSRIGALRVQTSTQGIPIPIAYGKTRLQPNLIDYRGFNSVPVTSTSESGGKGGGGVTTTQTSFNYFVAPILALCEGPLPTVSNLAMIGTAWMDKVVTSGANLGFIEFRGSYTQDVWDYMTNSYPADGRALRGQAYAAHNNFQLNNAGGLQNLSFEVRGRLFSDECEPDVNVGLVIPDLLSNPHYGLGWQSIGDLTQLVSYCDAAGFRVSPLYNAQRPASEMVTELAKVANSAPFWSEGLLKVVPYADAVVSRVPTQMAAADEVTETFPTGLSTYNISSPGNAALFTITSGTYGNQINLASQFTTDGSFQQRLLGATHTAQDISVKFMLNGNAPDDAGLFQLRSGGGTGTLKFGLNPMREANLDANLQRPKLTLDTETINLHSARLPFGVWFQLDLHIDAGIGNSTYVMTTISNGVVFNAGSFANSHSPFTYDTLMFAIDSTVPTFAPTAPSSYADVDIRFGNFTCVTGNSVSFTPDLTVQYALTTSDLIASAGDSPVKITRKRQADAYNVIQVSCLDRDNDYNKAVVEASDLGAIERFGRRVAPVIQADMICDLGVARAVAQTALQRAVYLRNTYAFTVGWRHCRLEPMDVVTLTDASSQLTAKMVRITAVQESDDDESLSMEAEDVLIGVSTPGSYAQQASSGYITNVGVDPGSAATPVIFQPPVELSGVPQIWIGASGGPSWGGAEIWASDDDISYAKVGMITQPARYGVVTANWPASADPDTTHNLSISLVASNGSLASATQLQADSGDSLCYVGAAVGGELIDYTVANLTGSHTYDLTTYIRRGQFCSFPAAHIVGESFMRIDGAIAKVSIDQSRVGTTVYYKLRSFNTQGGGLQDLASLTASTYVVQPVGLIVTNGVVPSTINEGQLLCIPEGAQYSVQGRMTDLGRINAHGRLIVTA